MNEETYGTCTEERSVRAPSSPSRALFWLGCLVAVAVCVRAADGSLRRTERTQSVSETVRSKRMQRCNLNEGEVWLIRHGEKADKLTPGTPEYWGLNASGFARAEYVAGLITSGVWPQFSRVYACHPAHKAHTREDLCGHWRLRSRLVSLSANVSTTASGRESTWQPARTSATLPSQGPGRCWSCGSTAAPQHFWPLSDALTTCVRGAGPTAGTMM
eukprot:TRINITY_DN11962_c0_g1_i2.p1 TRINITY_DN11962_c0_g1~~TRINITY_DN11962_c0_g1_i2.p1  ORF type:complete len:233 (+),score=0.91 TRINITY_DN11962_c0_g1_i2:52-699(+)